MRMTFLLLVSLCLGADALGLKKTTPDSVTIEFGENPPKHKSDMPRIADPTPKYSAPFNLTNGACKANKAPRHVMEIKNVAHGSYYIGTMGFGSPPQELNMLLDTGSDEIVVKGADCVGCKGRAYDHRKSAFSHINSPAGDPKMGKEEINYGSGDVWGQHFFDTIHMGPLSGPDMDILEVTETTISEFAETADTALEVIAGMAPGLPEYVGQRMASHMEVKRFSQCLPANSDENGFFVVNDNNPKDDKNFNGPFMSMGNYYWAVSIDGMRFDWTDEQKKAGVRGSKKPKKLANKKFSMLVDTGTTLLSLPQEVMDELDKALEEIDSDCSKMDQLPHLAFDIDGVKHTLPPNTYIAQEAKGMNFDKKKKKAALKERENEVADEQEATEERQAKLKNLYYKDKRFINKKTGAECHLLFTQPITMNSTLGQLGILGMPLFRNYMVTFDFCQRQIWTKPHTGDCIKSIGAHPSNKDACADGDSILCVFQNMGKSLYEGVTSIFSAQPRKRQIEVPKLKYIPGTDRLSAGAQWLLNQKAEEGSDGIVEL